MDIRIDKDLFEKLKLIQIKQFQEKYSIIKFKYKKYPFPSFYFIVLLIFSYSLFFP